MINSRGGIMRTGQIHPEVQKRIVRARELGVIENKAIQQLISLLIYGGYREAIVRQLDLILAQPYNYSLITGDPYPEPAPHLIAGDFLIGHTMRSQHPCYISKDQAGGFLIGGQRDSGKTTVIRNIGVQAMKHYPVWYLDIKSVDYADLMYNPKGWILDILDLRSNPLEPPPGVNPKFYASFFWDFFCEIFFEREIARGILLSITDRLYRLFGVYDSAQPEAYPSLIDVRDDLFRMRNTADPRGRQFGTIDSCLTRFSSIIYNIGPVIDVSSGYPIEEMEQHNIDFRFNTANYECSIFPIIDLISKVFCRRKAAYQRGEALFPLMIVIDEAYYLFSRRLNQLGIPVLRSELIISQCREFDIYLVCSTQSIPSILMALIDNAATKLILRQGDGVSIKEASMALGMQPSEARHIASLSPHEGFMRKPECPSIVHIETEKPMVPKKIDPKKTEECRQRALNHLKFKPRVPLKVMVEKRTAQGQTSKIPTGYRPQDQVSPRSRQLYIAALKERFIKITELYNKTGLSPATGKKTREELVRAGWVIQNTINLGRKGGNVIFIEPTDKGATALGLPMPQKPKGKGGFEHAFWIDRAKIFYEDIGYTVTIEETIAGKSIDLVARKENEVIAVEIERSSVHTSQNITKDLATGVISKVVVACKDKNTVTQAQKEFKKLSLDKNLVNFQLLSDFIK